MFIESYRKDEGLEKALEFCLKEFGREVDFTRSQYDLRRQELIRKTKGMEPWGDGSYSPEVLPGIGDD